MKVSAVILALLLPFGLSAEVRYTIVRLVPVDTNVGNSAAIAINQLGDAAGGFRDADQALHGFSFTDQGGFIDLGHGSAAYFEAVGINDAGQIAAYGPVDDTGYTHAFRYTPGVGFVDLGTARGRSAETTAINNSGQVVGFYEMNDGSEHAFIYTDGNGMKDLGVLSGQNSNAHAINDLGWVTGSSDNRAFLYKEETGMVDIGSGRGYAINNSGVVAGEVSWEPVIYRNGQVQYLGLPYMIPGGAWGINNHNDVVGGFDVYTPNWFMHAFIWSEQEGFQDLNTLIDPQSGWFLEGAAGINDVGQIVGAGFSPERGTVYTAFRLDPIPPRLQITLEGTNVVVSWIPRWPGLVLETANVQSPASWQAVPGGTNSPITLPASGRGQIFRLSQYESLDPKLTITPAGTNLVISWAPPWPDYALESAATLPPPSWSPVAGATNNPLIFPAAGAATFFRLRK